MALPKEPRQKMINLMYLVLTALLALNVSAEILNAFKTVDNSLDKTNSTINISTANIMESFKVKLDDAKTHEKAAIWYPKADSAQKLTKDMYTYIEALRAKLKKAADFDPVAKKGDSSYKEDNQDIPTRVMVEEGEGKKLQEKMKAYRTAMLSLVNPNKKADFEKGMQVDVSIPSGLNGGHKTWEDAYFHMVPTVAALTILRKFENDVKTTENKIISHLHEQVGKVEVIFDAFEAIVGQNAKYLMPGQELEISAGLGAFSKAKVPTITVGGVNVPTNEKGMAVYKTAAGTIGHHSVPVNVAFLDQDGKQQNRTFNVEYTVGQANASIALDKMNVLYIGVDNPLSIAASGGGDDRINATINNGSISRTGAGKWVARVNNVSDNTVITVNVDGKLAGSSLFRVRNIPTPAAFVGGMPSGANTSAAALANQAGIGAGIKDFPFELKYSVVEYTVIGLNEDGDVKKETGNGAAFTPGARKLIAMAKPGDVVYINPIYCVGPDGIRKKLPALVYSIN